MTSHVVPLETSVQDVVLTGCHANEEAVDVGPNPVSVLYVVKYDVTQCESCLNILPIPRFDIDLVGNTLRVYARG